MDFRYSRCLTTFSVLLSLAFPSLAHAATLNVPSAAYPTIQSGVDASHDGDTVLVADGTYTGPGNRDIDFHGKNITVTSQNGPAKTIIDCGGHDSPDNSSVHRGFLFESGETYQASIRNLTVKNGYVLTHDRQNGYGAGLLISNNSAPTITNCNFVNGTAYSGGGIHIGSSQAISIIAGCTFDSNTSAGYGGGGISVYGSNPIIRQCNFKGNVATQGGAIVLFNSAPIIVNCILSGNSASNVGGGIFLDSSNPIPDTPVLMNCTIASNSAPSGSVIYNVNHYGTIIVLINDILRDNTNSVIASFGGVGALVSFSNVQGGYPGTGNIDKDPLFVNAATGDLHLKPGSPCLVAGTPTGAPPTDLDSNPRPNPPSMGAYELGMTFNVPSVPYPTIQSGIDAAHDGDTVLVADGTYTGPGNRDIDFHGKSLTVTSQNGPSKTTIDCGGYASTNGSGNHRGFYIHSGETNAVISGFTVKNGYETYVSSIADSGYGGGICIVNSHGTFLLTNCTVSGNTAQFGGGIWIHNVSVGAFRLTNCTVSGNTAPYYGGNGGQGGGIFIDNSSSGTITLTNCTVFGNTTYHNGGGILNFNDGNSGTITLTNCTVFGNAVQYYDAKGGQYSGDGGGVHNENNVSVGTITLTNCTVFGNIAQFGGGVYNKNRFEDGDGNIYRSTITLTNNIIYGDSGGEMVNDATTSANAISEDSDIQGGYPGTGNIDKDPLFVNAATGDLHLKPGSPCLGAGTPAGAPPTDLDGNPRPNPPSMGAYELAAPATITGFTLSPAQINAPGPTVTASLTVSGTFSKVTLSPVPGSLGSASPTFNLMTNSGGGWGGSFPTAFLKLAKSNPVTFIAVGTRPDGTTASLTAPLQIGALPTLAFSLSSDKTSIHRSETFMLHGFISNLTTISALLATTKITLPLGINYLSSNGFVYDDTTRTLTLPVPPLAAGNGFYPIAVMLQADASAPKYTSLVIAANISCTGFQQVTQNPAVSIEAGQIPLGVEVDATGGFGILDGTADVDLSQGNSPLHATLTPTTGINSLLPVFGSTHRASIWLEAYVSKNGNATFTPGGSGAAYFLAQNGLISPSVSPIYIAAFYNINDSVTVSASFTPRAASLTLIDTMITSIAAQTLKPIPSVDTIFSVWNEISQLSAFVTATNAFTKNPPKNKLQLLQDTALASKALLTISGPEKAAIITVLKKYKVIDDYDVGSFDAFQKLLGRAFGADNLLHVAADAFTIDGATLGDPMVVTFRATPISIQKSRSTQEKDIVSKAIARN